MTGTWQLLRSLLIEARSIGDYKEDIFRHVTKRYGEHAADELRNKMKSLKFGEFKRHAAMEFMDPTLDSKINDLAKAAIEAHRIRQGQQSPEQQPGQTKGPSGRIYTDPDAEAQRQSKIDAMRQARSGAGSGGSDAAKALMTPARLPGGKPGHAVGSAGQNQARPQPSVAAGVRPRHSADDLKKMRVSRSGLVKAQREVDRETREKGAAAGEKLARSLGVPSTAERTQVNPDSGQKSIQIWGPDRVLKHMDPDRNPDRPPGEKLGRIELIKRGLIQRSAAPTKLGPDRPGSFHGERWKPRGREEEVPMSRPDPTTGNWIRGKQVVNPKHTGQEVVWNRHAGEWQLPSVFAAQGAERNARPQQDFGDEPTSQDASPFSDEGDRTDPSGPSYPGDREDGPDDR